MIKKIISIMFCIISVVFSIQEISDEINILSRKIYSDLPSNDTEFAVMVLPFEGGDEEKKYQTLLPDMIIKNLIAKNITIVERDHMEAIFEETDLSGIDLIDTTTRIIPGHIKAAAYIISGKIIKQTTEFKITIRLIETKTTKIIGVYSSKLDAEKLGRCVNFVNKGNTIVVNSIFKSFLIPGWGQLSSGHTSRGIIALTLGLGAGGTLAYGIFSSYNANSEMKSHENYKKSPQYKEKCSIDSTYPAKWQVEYSGLIDDYNDKSYRAKIIYAVTGGIWALNVIDALIAGYQTRNKFKLYYFTKGFSNYKVGFSFNF